MQLSVSLCSLSTFLLVDGGNTIALLLLLDSGDIIGLLLFNGGDMRHLLLDNVDVDYGVMKQKKVGFHS